MRWSSDKGWAWFPTADGRTWGEVGSNCFPAVDERTNGGHGPFSNTRGLLAPRHPPFYAVRYDQNNTHQRKRKRKRRKKTQHMRGSSSYSGQAQAHGHLGYTSKRLGKGGLIQHRRFTHHRKRGIALWFFSSYRPSLFHRGWMVSHAEMGCRIQHTPRLPFYVLLLSHLFSLLYETGSCHSTFFNLRPDHPPGTWHYHYCLGVACANQQWPPAILFSFLFLVIFITVVFHWCDASSSIISLRLLADIKWFIGVGSDTSGGVGCVSFCWVWWEDPWRGVGVSFLFLAGSFIYAVFSGLPPVSCSRESRTVPGRACSASNMSTGTRPSFVIPVWLPWMPG